MSKRHGGRRPPEAPQYRLTAASHEILTKAPLRQASEQMREGWDGERGPKAARWYWDGCPELKPVLTGEDLTGLKQGRLTCVGLLAKKGGPNTKASWVVRCACGMFETRSAKALRNPVNANDGCSRCNYVWHLRRQAFFDKRGRWPAADEVVA